MGVIGTILLPVVLVATLAGPNGPGDDGEAGSAGGGGFVAAPESSGGGGGSGVAPGDVVPVPRDRGFAPGQSNRRIERSISLDLEVLLDKMARVAEDATAVTNRHGGFVLSSSWTRARTAGEATSRCASRRTVCARRCATWPNSLPSSARRRRAGTSPSGT